MPIFNSEFSANSFAVVVYKEVLAADPATKVIGDVFFNLTWSVVKVMLSFAVSQAVQVIPSSVEYCKPLLFPEATLKVIVAFVNSDSKPKNISSAIFGTVIYP